MLAGRAYAVQGYRPRIEGLFSRIERWRNVDTGQTHWRTITAANVTTVYGATANSRIADPSDPARVFSWLVCASHDDAGNAIVYEYQAEDGAGVDTSVPSEQNRSELSRSAARYVKRIRYGNRMPWWAPGHPRRHAATEPDDPGWMFEVVFDYGDHEPDAPRPFPARRWPCRPDPFSTYRPGFDLRTYRRCHRVLMFHHFPDEPGVGDDCLVSSTDLSYTDIGPGGMTTLASVTHSGYRRGAAGGYVRRALPSLEFRYSQAVMSDQVRDLSPDALENLPAGISGTGYQWVDLDGEGLSGILARQGGAWFYKANLGDGWFAPERVLSTQPAMAATGQRQELLDLAGDGHLDLAELGGPMPGFYERRSEGGWHAFRPFRSWPNISWNDPDLRMVDLDGDGLADVLITGDDAFTWYPVAALRGLRTGASALTARGRRNTGPAAGLRRPRADHLPRRHDRRRTVRPGPGAQRGDVLLAEPRLRPVRRQGNHGPLAVAGRAGPVRPARVRLADIDGSGTADLVYLGAAKPRVYLNQSGNGFSEGHRLTAGSRRWTAWRSVMVADLLGRGTALPGLVLAAARRGRPPAALPRPDGGGQAVPPDRGGQQPRRGDDGSIRALDPVLPRRQGGRDGRG